MSEAEFEAADYYDYHQDSEALSHEDPVEALEAFLDDLTEAEVADLKDVTIYAFKRRVVADKWVGNTADRLAEQASEWWSEEYGDPDGDFSLDTDGLRAACLSALTAAVSTASVWVCEQVAQKTYSAAEALTLVRPSSPDTHSPTEKKSGADTRT